MAKIQIIIALTSVLVAHLTMADVATPGATNIRISNTGAIFVRDTSNPKLGEAFRDQNGLIWGSAVFHDAQVMGMTYYDADKYCREVVGGRLPTYKEWTSLRKMLTKKGPREPLGLSSILSWAAFIKFPHYSPYSTNGKGEILLGLSLPHGFWAGFPDIRTNYEPMVFFGSDASYIVSQDLKASLHAVICVSDSH